MKRPENPFLVKGYIDATYFCDREEETQLLIERAKNGINTMLFSIRRMGKTGLISHVFTQIEENNQYKGIYIDIYATQNLSEFNHILAGSVLRALPSNKSIGKKFLEMLKGFRPVISYDSYTGNPEISFDFKTQQEYETSIYRIFEFLENQKQHIVIAFDEFQQIANYPEKNTEALLRTIIQQLQNVSFIFSGSQKHILIELFNSSKRPFFASTQPMYLPSIPTEKYFEFIQRTFKNYNIQIDDPEINFILDWTKKHTYYTQAFCNKLFSLFSKKKRITMQEINICCDTLLKEQEIVFYQYRNLLTSNQWQLLGAIAKEDEISEPTSYAFVAKYNLGNASSVRRSLLALIEKEMIVELVSNENKSRYRLYDGFLSRWLERN